MFILVFLVVAVLLFSAATVRGEIGALAIMALMVMAPFGLGLYFGWAIATSFYVLIGTVGAFCVFGLVAQALESK